MRRLSLGTLLTTVNVGLVAAAVVCVVAAAGGLLRRMADEQALARAGLAASGAARVVERAGDQLSTSARLLAESPALSRLLLENDAAGLQDFIGRFRRTSRLSACAVFLDGAVLARAGASLPWEEIARQPRAAESQIALGARTGGPLILSGWSAVPSPPQASVAVALALDDEFIRATTVQVGMPVAILDRRQAIEEAPQAALRARALDAEAPVADRLDEAGLYVAIRPLRAPGGEVVGLIETSLPSAGALPSQHRFMRSLLLMAMVVGGLAALASVLIGRRLVRPLEALTTASARIGLGDLSTPIARVPGAETGALATTMEEMRGHLLHLTAELRRRQAEAEGILTGIVEGVFSVDRERRIRYLNPQAAALLGVRPEDAIGRFCGDVLNPQGPEGVRPCEERCPIVHARFRGSARATENLLLLSGERRSVVITSAPAGGEGSGDAAGAGAPFDGARQFQVMRDETEVEATRRLRDTVLANITHEFRTPLSAQLASIELLRDRLPDLNTAEARDLVLALERGTLRLTQLIDNLLESVRIDAGHDSIRHQPVALDEVVDEAVDLAAPLLALRDQKLDVDLPYPLPAVNGDAPRLVQVFVNLLANAHKFAPAGSAIAVGGEVRDSEITLWVEDEGPGLPPEAGDRLFERFMRAAGEEPRESGMGLGLFIVKSIVERHGGRVEVRGRGAVAGTRMCVILPAGGER
jgi:signal transduction histidine kinase/HAMP domain-containing protein